MVCPWIIAYKWKSESGPPLAKMANSFQHYKCYAIHSGSELSEVVFRIFFHLIKTQVTLMHISRIFS